MNRMYVNIDIVGLISSIIHGGAQMINNNKNLLYEIRKVREQLNECIEKNGINDDKTLIDINNRLDEMILQWIKNGN